MSDKKVIAVLGATGAQGGGLVRAILADTDGPFTARAITRDVHSDKAKALAAAGAEVVAADVDDEASLVKAFAGAHGAFCVTFFWAHFSPERELAEAAAMARAVKAAGVSHAIWSTLEDTRRFDAARRRPDADADGQVQGAAFRCQGRSRRVLPRVRRADDAAAHLVLLGQLHLLRVGPQAGPRRHAGPHLPDGRARSCQASPPKTSAGRPTRSSRRARGRSARRLASRAITSRLDEMAAACTRALGRPVRYNEVDPGGLPRLRVPRRRRPGQHVPVQARLQRRVLRGARPGEGAGAQPRACRRSTSGWRRTPARIPLE